jgi:hypothetical protein
MSDITVDEQMLVSAVRYALGRATYIVSATVRETIRAWPHLSENARTVIERDVREAFYYHRTGMDCDTAQWQRLLDHIEAHR